MTMNDDNDGYLYRSENLRILYVFNRAKKKTYHSIVFAHFQNTKLYFIQNANFGCIPNKNILFFLAFYLTITGITYNIK